MADVRAILFDLDGTLVDSAEAVLRAWRAWAVSVGVDPQRLAGIVHGRSAADIVRSLLPDLPRAEIQRHAREVLQIQELDPHPARPAPGSRALIDRLDGHPWAVVTGCSVRMSMARLAAGGLPVPPVLVTDEDVQDGKPSPEGYLLALSRLKVAGSDVVVVEDAPAGIAAAKAAGLRAVAVTSTHSSSALTGADVVVSGLAAIQVTIRECIASLLISGGSGAGSSGSRQPRRADRSPRSE